MDAAQVSSVWVDEHEAVKSPWTPDPFEDNGTVEQATVLESDDQSLCGLSIHQALDQDWYAWTAERLGTANFAVDPHSEVLGLALSVQDAAGNELGSIPSSSDDTFVSVFVEPGHTYFIHVSPDDLEVGEYCLNIDQFVPYALDTELQPRTVHLPGIGGGPDRAVAVIVGPNGGRDEFVVNELIVTTQEPDALERLLERYDGSLIATPQIPLPPPQAEWNLAPRDDFPTGQSYLIRVDPASAEANDLERWMTSLEAVGQATFSSTDALRLFAIAAKERVDHGMDISPNFLSELFSPNIVLFKTDELRDIGTPFNGFSLPEVRSQNLELARAWQFVDLLDLNRKVDLAVVDQGFALNADFPPKALVPMYDFVGDDYDALDREADEKGKEWHGTGTLSTAAARMDNAFGSVGTGAQVASPMVFHTENTLFGMTRAMRSAAKWGAEVINVSMGAECGFGCGMFAVFSGAGAIASAVRDINNSGATIVAAAGNEAWNLDQKLLLPAELPGVIGVGAIDPDTGTSTSFSSYGSNVDIWAPGDKLTATPTPQTKPRVSRFGGTSGASPYIAGIVALMKAIDPSLNSHEVKTILQATANRSTDPRVATGYVNAYEAVKATAAQAGIQPLGDIYEPDDPGNHPVKILFDSFTATRTIAPGDWDVFEFETTDYVDIGIEVTYFDQVTPGNELQFEFDGILSGIDAGGGLIRLRKELVRPGQHTISVWGSNSDSINAYKIEFGMTPSQIDPDRFDDERPEGESRNDDFAAAARIPGEIDASLLLATRRIDELNFERPSDRDFFTIQLPPINDRDTGQSECLTLGDPRLGDKNTVQGSFQISVTPDALRPFDIGLYHADGTPVPQFTKKSAFTYQLDCPHRVFPDGKITWALDDPAGRNFYEVDLKYHRWDTLITPNWFLEAEQPPFHQNIPAFLDNIARMFPSDPETIERHFEDKATDLPAEFASFQWSAAADYVLDVAFPSGESFDVSLIDSDGHIIAKAEPLIFASPPSDRKPVLSKRLTVPSLPVGTYSIMLAGDSFGMPYQLQTKSVASNAGDINRDQVVDALDIDTLFAAIARGETGARFDLDEDQSVNQRDVDFLVEAILDSTVGDANLDGTFNSTDLVQIFQAGRFEDQVPRNATWATGDWNGDLEFTTADLVAAFQKGGYSVQARPGE